MQLRGWSHGIHAFFLCAVPFNYVQTARVRPMSSLSRSSRLSRAHEANRTRSNAREANVTRLKARSASRLPQANKTWLKERLGIAEIGVCKADGSMANMGCALGCQCGWTQRCYPKSIVLGTVANGSADQWDGQRADVGMCEMSLITLTFCSVGVFLLGLIIIVSLRLQLLGQCCGDIDSEELDQKPPPPRRKESLLSEDISATDSFDSVPLEGSPEVAVPGVKDASTNHANIGDATMPEVSVPPS